MTYSVYKKAENDYIVSSWNSETHTTLVVKKCSTLNAASNVITDIAVNAIQREIDNA